MENLLSTETKGKILTQMMELEDYFLFLRRRRRRTKRETFLENKRNKVAGNDILKFL